MKDLLLLLGSAAELCGLLRDLLMRNGFTREEAVVMTTEYLKILATPKQKEEK